MNPTERSRTTRWLLLLAGCLALGGVLGCRAGEPETVTFYAIGDPQINIPRWGTAGTESTIESMNGLPGEVFLFGKEVGEPAGVIVAGDLVDDLENPENWELYKRLFDPAGLGRLRFPVFDGQGNHDVDVRNQAFGEFNETQREFIERNRARPGEFVFGPEGYHYSWVWAGVRFVQLNIFPGTVHRPVYGAPAPGNDPKGSLAFLQRILTEHVGDTGQPLVLIWHYGLRGWGFEEWWVDEDLDALESTLEGFNVVLLLHGHEHRYERYRWRGYDVIMAPSPQHDRDPDEPETESRPKGFLVFRITSEELQMGYRTPEGWVATWARPLAPRGHRGQPERHSRTARPMASRWGTSISSYSREITIPAAPASNALSVAR